ncbi:MAG: LEA type 2 family protein [Nitrospirota bacterium]
MRNRKRFTCPERNGLPVQSESEDRQRRQKLLAAVLVVLIAVSLSACSMKSAVRKMSLELKTVHINDMTLKGFDAEIDLQITNPNWFTVRISDLDYHAYVSGEEIASGQAENEIAIPSGSTTVVTLPVKVSYGSLGGKIAQILFKGNLEYRLQGSAVFHTWFASRTVPFDTKEKKFEVPEQ